MKWEKIIIAAVSAAFAGILYFLLPIESNKYRLRVEDELSFGSLFSVLHADLDGDGSAEYVRCKKGIPVPAIVVQKAHYQVVGQWNLNGEWIKLSEPQVTDFDHDGISEIVGFTYHNDSVWIHVIEALQEDGMLIHQAIDHVQLFNGNQDWRVIMSVLEDPEGKGSDKFVISIRSGFTLQPRSLYIFDPGNGDIKSQDQPIWNMINKPVLVDVDQDGSYEITGNTSAPGNVKDPSAPYSDSCAWFMIFNQDLQFKCPPIPYQGTPSYFRVLPLKEKEQQLLLSLHFTKTPSGTINLLELWGWKHDSLVLLRSREIVSDERMELVSADPMQNGSFYVSCMDELVEYDQSLEEVQRRKLVNGGSWNDVYSLDVDEDAVEELLVYSKGKHITLMRRDLSNPISFDLGFMDYSPVINCYTENSKHYIDVFRDHESIILSYSKNPYYPFRILIYILSFLAYYFIFSLLFRFQRKRIEKSQASERQVLHYQLANVMQQLDPHFLFNALSNISSYYHKGEKEHAQNYLAKLSKLIRSSLENSERMTISLKEELAFVGDYLYVEGIRMGDRLDYSIEVDEGVIAGVQVPKMLIQNFVENAMKHGVRHLTGRKGRISVFASTENGYIDLCIEDNGVGRKKAAEIGSFGTGNGLNMVRKTLGIFDKLEKIRITYEIEDLYDENLSPTGTRVLLKIPMK